MNTVDITHFHLFFGLGGGAAGFQATRPEISNTPIWVRPISTATAVRGNGEETA
jgi:hypothetical protein